MTTIKNLFGARTTLLNLDVLPHLIITITPILHMTDSRLLVKALWQMALQCWEPMPEQKIT
jgi:hypothetical protein